MPIPCSKWWAWNNTKSQCAGCTALRVPIEKLVQLLLCSCSSSVLSSQQFSQCTVWVNELLRDIGLFWLRGSVSHVKKVNHLSNLWINAYWRRKPFQTIQFDLVNWFNRFTMKNRLNRTIRSRIGHHYSTQPQTQKPVNTRICWEMTDCSAISNMNSFHCTHISQWCLVQNYENTQVWQV